MARRKPRRSPPAPAADPAAPAPAPEAPARGPVPWAKWYIAAFVVLQAGLLAFFVGLGGNGERERNAELRRVWSAADEGRYEVALERLEAFGRRWPGSWSNGPFTRGHADLLAQVGRHAEAVEAYERSLENFARAGRAVPPGLRASAGEAHWIVGRRERAMELLAAEVAEGDAAHPAARGLLGAAAFEQGDLRAAFAHFRAARPEAMERPEVRAAVAAVEADLVQPARALAALAVESPSESRP